MRERLVAEDILSVYLGWLALAASLVGASSAILGVVLLRQRSDGCSGWVVSDLPGVTVLKPLHGAPDGLEQALATSLQQTYSGPLQIIFGVQSECDPAIGVVRRIQNRFSHSDIELVVDSRLHGPNRKISNLANMASAAKHDTLVVADADIIVPENWLSSVMATLGRRNIGAVSCFYTGLGNGFWGRLSAMGINYHFLPQAKFGTATRLAHPFFGTTMAFTRETLEALGGFGAFRNCLADDYEIGRAVRGLGYELGYAPVLVQHLCADGRFSELWRRELRWARTIRMINPWGHWGSLVSHTLPLAALGAVLLDFSIAGCAALASALVLRLFLKREVDHISGMNAGPGWLLPFRDVLYTLVVLASGLGLDVHWRGDRLRVSKSGLLTQVSG